MTKYKGIILYGNDAVFNYMHTVHVNLIIILCIRMNNYIYIASDYNIYYVCVFYIHIVLYYIQFYIYK